jgi:hypothetical protein
MAQNFSSHGFTHDFASGSTHGFCASVLGALSPMERVHSSGAARVYVVDELPSNRRCLFLFKYTD